jgi:hypothetical protein
VNLERALDLLHWLSNQRAILAVTPAAVQQAAAGLANRADRVVLLDQPWWLWGPVAMLVGVGALVGSAYLVSWLWQWLLRFAG